MMSRQLKIYLGGLSIPNLFKDEFAEHSEVVIGLID